MTRSYDDFKREYIRNDLDNPKETTRRMLEFLDRFDAFGEISSDGVVVDMGTGGGSALYWWASKKGNEDFVGVDYNREALEYGRDAIISRDGQLPNNMRLIHGDWDSPAEILRSLRGEKIKLLTSVHSLCTQKDFMTAAKKLVDLKPEKIAFNSLFYNGPLDVLIHIRSHEVSIEDNNPDADFNIHSLPQAIELMRSMGYRLIGEEEFDIGFSIERPKTNGRGTYTVKTEMGDYTQFSGPVYLPWRYVLFGKEDA